MSSDPIKVLIVEDNQPDFRLISEYLKESVVSSFGIMHADTIAGALKIIEKKKPDVSLLDLDLPDSRGLATLTAVVNADPQLAIVVVTGLDDERLGIEALQKGAQDYLVKGRIQSDALIRSMRYSIERKRLQYLLANRAEELRTLLDSVPAMVFYKDKENRLIRTNKAFEDTMELPKEGLEGKSLSEIFPKDRAEMFWRDDLEVIKSGEAKRGIIELMETPRGMRLLQTDKIPCLDEKGEVSGVIGFSIDITSRKQAEMKHSVILKTAAQGFWLIDMKDKLLEVNDAYCRMSGYSKEELLKVHVQDLVAKERRKDVFNHIKLVQERGQDQFESRHRRKDGTFFDVDIRANYLNIENGRVVVFVWDITERKKVEEALHESQERFKVLTEAMPQVVWSAEASGKMDYLNHRAYEYEGMQSDGLMDWHWKSVVHPDDFAETTAAWRHSLKTGEAYMVEHRLRRADGQFRWHLTRGVPIRNSKGRIVRWIGTATDIHDRKLAEEVLKRDKDTFEKLIKERTEELLAAQLELERAKHLADIGTLAAIVAHELRNPLAAISMAVTNVKRKAKNPLINGNIYNIEKKIFESDQIINNLLLYSRIGLPQYEDINIYDIVQDCVNISKNRFKKKVAINNKLNAIKGIIIEADPLQVREVCGNILNNAYDAVSEKSGKIEIGASVDGEFITIVFRDNGVGIGKEDLEKVFEPFFTTKAKGTGLGLAVCHQIAKVHGGKIHVESKAGKGTAVTVRLPVRKTKRATGDGDPAS
ncbi:MAG: PAS domain S-box protein [Candidatus Aureabacteria bacterium]|nr:PAS domain S-box protein [Candidatus Auribacterota bacterium]